MKELSLVSTAPETPIEDAERLQLLHEAVRTLCWTWGSKNFAPKYIEDLARLVLPEGQHYEFPYASVPPVDEFATACAAHCTEQQGQVLGAKAGVKLEDPKAEYERLCAILRPYVLQTGHDLCWIDFPELRRLLPEAQDEPLTCVPDKETCKKLCAYFRACLEPKVPPAKTQV